MHSPWPMIMFMFSSSIILGCFITGMTPLMSDTSHYTVSITRTCASWYMASWMGVIEIVMSYRMMKMWNANHTRWLAIMLLNAGASYTLLQSQLFVNEDSWATRMIEHHSTAITTSKKLCRHCDRSETLCELACQIVETQLDEIDTLKSNSNYVTVSLISSASVILLTLPVALISYFNIS